MFLNNTKEIAKILENKNSVKLNEFNSIQEIKPYFYTDLGKLYNGDCLELFKQVPDENVDTIFADPPFNLDKEYDEGVTASYSHCNFSIQHTFQFPYTLTDSLYF